MKSSNEVLKKLQLWLKKFKYAVIVILAGVFLLMLPTGEKAGQSPEPAVLQSEPEFSVSEMESRLSEALSEIDGAGAVTVVLTLKSSTEQVLATDKTGSGRTVKGESGESSVESSEKTVIVSAGSQVQTPVTVKYIYPEYQGALVIAEGASSAAVRLELLSAVAGLTGLKSDKITITKMKTP